MTSRLDAAIDRAARRLVDVREDDELRARIINSLPERRSSFGWLIPQVVAIGTFAIVAMFWMTREATQQPSLPSTNLTVAVALAPSPLRESGTALRTEPLEPMEPVEPLEPIRFLTSDFERSLPPIDSLPSLALDDVRPGELRGTGSLVVAPLEISNLALTVESFSQQ